jgi:hypothetical protein
MDMELEIHATKLKTIIKLMHEGQFTGYCLGVGCMAKCDSCQYEKNWQLLEELGDGRLAMQSKMTRVNESVCQITSGTLYKELV